MLAARFAGQIAVQSHRRALLKALPVALLPISVDGRVRLSEKDLDAFLRVSALRLQCPPERLDRRQGQRLLTRIAQHPHRWKRYRHWLCRPDHESAFAQTLLTAWYHGILRDETTESVFPPALGLLYEACPWVNPPGICLGSPGDWSRPPNDLRIQD